MKWLGALSNGLQNSNQSMLCFHLVVLFLGADGTQLPTIVVDGSRWKRSRKCGQLCLPWKHFHLRRLLPPRH